MSKTNTGAGGLISHPLPAVPGPPAFSCWEQLYGTRVNPDMALLAVADGWRHHIAGILQLYSVPVGK